jgi:hypothetical protein
MWVAIDFSEVPAVSIFRVDKCRNNPDNDQKYRMCENRKFFIVSSYYLFTHSTKTSRRNGKCALSFFSRA